MKCSGNVENDQGRNSLQFGDVLDSRGTLIKELLLASNLL